VPRVLVIDNYDSFVYNLVQYLGELGAEPVVHRHDAITLEQMDESPGRKKNAAAEGLINDTREHVQEIESGPALDAVLISGIQKTEHYCIAAWGTARSLGESAGEKEVVKSMERALKEGRQMDEALTKLAEETINPQVFAEESQDEESDEGTDEEGGSARSSGRGGKQQRQEQRTSR